MVVTNAQLIRAGALLALLGGAFALKHNVAPPCSFRWRVGKVDARFQMSDAEVRAAAEAGAQVWQDVLGRKVIRYDAARGLPIDLIYDERQAGLDDERRAIAEIEALRADIERYRRFYEDDATRDEFTRMRLNRKIAEYNQRIDEFNARPIQLQRVGSFEQIVQPGWWWKAMFHRLPAQIEVYQILDAKDLAFTLAHEFGHGLGLMHVPEADAIMQPVKSPALSADSPRANATEAAMLRDRCGR